MGSMAWTETALPILLYASNICGGTNKLFKRFEMIYTGRCPTVTDPHGKMGTRILGEGLMHQECNVTFCNTSGRQWWWRLFAFNCHYFNKKCVIRSLMWSVDFHKLYICHHCYKNGDPRAVLLCWIVHAVFQACILCLEYHASVWALKESTSEFMMYVKRT